MDTLRFNNDVDFRYRLATVLEMRLNHEYWCEPEYTWQTNSNQYLVSTKQPQVKYLTVGLTNFGEVLS